MSSEKKGDNKNVSNNQLNGFSAMNAEAYAT